MLVRSTPAVLCLWQICSVLFLPGLLFQPFMGMRRVGMRREGEYVIVQQAARNCFARSPIRTALFAEQRKCHLRGQRC